eukprot:CAMPEP_0182876886 /NCGR_PEP_ID=MMETSP0034_2-20130328/14407_1 /TAXON_ID=156128 /ORGANISM="Nephroselmis pyriformis, Strain CCMP717" /LENGTH=142 /DNA_ID=CAMNT_0025009697 /DNA_START=33 /DNA_END=461 /DNA_ORIENTATION=-
MNSLLGADELPMLSVPHDNFRQGLPTLKEEIHLAHPVEAIQKNFNKNQRQTRAQMMQNVYGTALPIKMEIESQILGRVSRLPGLQSSRLGLEALDGTLDDFGFESYLGLPENREDRPLPIHDVMEAKLGLTPQASAVTRAMP